MARGGRAVPIVPPKSARHTRAANRLSVSRDSRQSMTVLSARRTVSPGCSAANMVSCPKDRAASSGLLAVDRAPLVGSGLLDSIRRGVAWTDPGGLATEDGPRRRWRSSAACYRFSACREQRHDAEGQGGSHHGCEVHPDARGGDAGERLRVGDRGDAAPGKLAEVVGG
jgi:hypothetical protein